MWGWVDHLGGVVFRAGLSATILSSLVVLAMIGCRQPARRIALARSALLGVLALFPLVALAPLPRFDLVAALRVAGILPHPLLSASDDVDAEAGASGTADVAAVRRAPGVSGLIPSPGGPWLARGLLLLYLAGVGTCLTDLVVGYWGLGWLTRQSTAPSTQAQAIYDAQPYAGRRVRPRLRVATRVRRPVLLGGLRPTILIPAALDAVDVDGAPDATEALRLSFLHELAHAERSDGWFNLAGGLAHAFWFFLPPLWWIRARMQLDHEFLADRHASLGFDAPGTYASSLVGMATPRPATSGPSTPGPGTAGAGVGGSSLFQRVLMLVQCPFAVESRPPTWWRWSLPLLTILITTATACLSLDAALVARSPRTTAQPSRPQTFCMARLAIYPRDAGPNGRANAVELPLRLPEQFELTLEVWGDRALLSGCRVVGQRLGPPGHDPDDLSAIPDEPETWHRILFQVRRNPRKPMLSIDGRPVPGALDRDQLTPRLAIEPPPGRLTLLRNLRVTWTSPRSTSP